MSPRRLVWLLALALPCCVLAAVMLGAVRLPALDVLAVLVGRDEGLDRLAGLSFAALDDEDFLAGTIELWPVSLTDEDGR